MEFDYSKLLGKIKEVVGKQEELAKKIKLSQVTLNKKLNNQGTFSQDTIISIISELGIPFEEIPIYFFCTKS